jgi:hypothetical protein
MSTRRGMIVTLAVVCALWTGGILSAADKPAARGAGKNGPASGRKTPAGVMSETERAEFLARAAEGIGKGVVFVKTGLFMPPQQPKPNSVSPTGSTSAIPPTAGRARPTSTWRRARGRRPPTRYGQCWGKRLDDREDGAARAVGAPVWIGVATGVTLCGYEGCGKRPF